MLGDWLFQRSAAGCITLLWILGEFGVNQATCSSLWQWAKQESMNDPLRMPVEDESESAASIWRL